MDKDVLALLQRYDETYNPPQTLSNSGIYILYFIESKRFYIGSCKDLLNKSIGNLCYD